ncbi:hypothetical protein AN958_12637 [Leucoagaricus sp. SymC.cos]|nr:hypothetical protein AN958_12637 [Leucoagaricus sp. SymC.cos]
MLSAPSISSGSSDFADNEEPESFDQELNRQALARTYSAFPNHPFWPRGSLNLPMYASSNAIPSGSGSNNRDTQPSMTGGSCVPYSEGGRPMSPVSPQPAMPNGQALCQPFFLPISVVLNDGSGHDRDVDMGQDRDMMNPLNELGFEFVNEQALGEGFGVSSSEAVEMEWRGRDGGWEDLGEDDVTQTELDRWLGVAEN